MGKPSRPFVAALSWTKLWVDRLRFLDDAELQQFVDLRADG